MPPAVVNLDEKFARIAQPWQPRIAGRVNDCAVKLVRFVGEFLWHHHEREDEMFLVAKGSLIMRFRDGDVAVNEGEFIIVPRGVEHCPVARDECLVVLFEPDTTLNTGNVVNERTITKLKAI